MFHCHNNESLVFKQIKYMKNTKNFTTFSMVTTLLFSRHVKGYMTQCDQFSLISHLFLLITETYITFIYYLQIYLQYYCI